MPIQKTVTLYAYNELSESAKEKARNWYLSKLCWREEVEIEIENWKELAEKLGFSINHNGGPFWDADHGIFHFDGSFRRPDDADLDALKKEWGPNPETGLAGNPDVLSLIDEVCAIKPGFWGAIAKRGVVRSEIDHDDPDLEAFEGDLDEWQTRKDQIEKEEDRKLEDALASLNALGIAWIRAQIENVESEEYISDYMEANEYLFHVDGTRAWTA